MCEDASAVKVHLNVILKGGKMILYGLNNGPLEVADAKVWLMTVLVQYIACRVFRCSVLALDPYAIAGGLVASLMHANPSGVCHPL